MRINLPNRLTIFRIILVPIFVLLFYISMNNNDNSILNTNIYKILSAILFIIASITDYFDGVIARKYNLITNFGKLMDPLADKILVISALMLLSANNDINVIWIIIVVIREIAISAIRLVCLEQGNVVAASIYGKYKTSLQMIAIILLLFNIHTLNIYCYYFVYTIFYISEFFVIFSFYDYIKQNIKSIINGPI